MVLINRALCSDEFIAAFDALADGRKVRMNGWPEGQVLEQQDDCIRVLRPGSNIAPAWQGPSSSETGATDWVII